MIIRTSSKTLLEGMQLSRRTRHWWREQSRLRLNGSEFLECGWKELPYSICIVSQSFGNIGKLLWNCFEWSWIKWVSLFGLTLMSGTIMWSNLFIWMTNHNLMYHSFLRCCLGHLLLLGHSGMLFHHLSSALQNMWLFHVLTGIKGFVKTWAFAQTVSSMGSVVSARVDTEWKMIQSAKLLSKLEQEKEELMTVEWAWVAKEGPRSLRCPGEKRKGDEDVVPKFHHQYIWGNSSTDNISPSALYTETTLPLPQPPDHLVNNLIIQGTIKNLGDHIKVEMPFDIAKFESQLNDHPNPPLVQSVMQSLCEGVWLLSEGDWKGWCWGAYRELPDGRGWFGGAVSILGSRAIPGKVVTGDPLHAARNEDFTNVCCLATWEATGNHRPLHLRDKCRNSLTGCQSTLWWYVQLWTSSTWCTTG